MTPTNGPGSDPTAFPPPASPVEQPQVLQPPPQHLRSKKPLIAALAVIAILGAGVGVFIATRSDDKDSSAATDSPLVRYNYDDEELEVLDASGDVVDSFDVPGASDDPFVTGWAGRVIFTAASGDEVLAVKVADGSVDRFDVPDELSLDRTYIAGSTNLVLYSPTGGDVVVIDLETGDSTSALDELGDRDSKLTRARQFATGSTYTDVGGDEQQTLVVPIVGSELWAVPGFVVVLDGERSLAIAPDDESTTVSIYERDKDIGSVKVDGSVRGGVLTGDDSALVVTAEGDIVKIDIGAEEATVTDTLANPIQSALALTPKRIFVQGDESSSFLLDDAGKTIAEFEPVDDDDGDPQAIVAFSFRAGAECFATQAGPEPGPDASAVVIRDLDSGDVLTELDSGAVVIGDHGCAAVTPYDSTADVYFDGEVHEFDGYFNVVTVSPDLTQVVVSGEDGSALIDVASGDETELDRFQYAFVTG